MDEQLIANWNACIAPNDTVFFLGDLGLGTTDFLTDLCSRLHGNKICIRGNHDGTPAKMHKIGFLLALESAFIKVDQHQVELIHVPSHPAPSHFQLHGHVHEKRPNKLVGRQLNISVEVWDYKPVSEKPSLLCLIVQIRSLNSSLLMGFNCSVFLAVQYILNS